MRVILVVAWLFVGLGGVIYHFGPGQQKMQIDSINQTLASARQSVEEGSWHNAVELFDEALSELPAEKVEQSQRVQLEKAKAQMMAKQLPDARQALETLLADARSVEDPDPHFVADVQSTLANSQYYMTWLMRLEGLPETEWKPEIESARQHYAQLATDARELGDEDLLKRSSEDLESTIRLARMDLSELQGLPLPSQ